MIKRVPLLLDSEKNRLLACSPPLMCLAPVGNNCPRTTAAFSYSPEKKKLLTTTVDDGQPTEHNKNSNYRDTGYISTPVPSKLTSLK